MDGFIPILVVCVISILIIRFLGAWMLRIDEVIDLQKKTIDEIKSIKSKLPD